MAASLTKCLADQRWRLNNLYKILDEDGQQVTFVMNPPQLDLYDNMKHKNVVLKARQIGFSTFIDLFILDSCLFRPGTEAMIVADTLPNAEDIFRRKILYPFEHLPVELRELLPTKAGTKGAAGQLQLSNESVINVTVSARSATAQIIHSSELAKVAAEHPDKAEEFVSGTLSAASSQNALVFIESTARGNGGVFYDFCKLAMDTEEDVQAGKREFHRMDWKFHFYPWFLDPKYTLDADVVISADMQEYFTQLTSKHQIDLTDEQKKWYVTKVVEQGAKMWSEFPSFPQEAFDQLIKGAYFTSQFTAARKNNQFTKVPYDSRIAVDTYWDIGMDDATSIWFVQDFGKEIRLIDYLEDEGEGLAHYKRLLDDKPYAYGRHVGPHDLGVRELSTGASRLQTAAKLGMRFTVVPRVGDKRESIDAARSIFSRCWFDEERCAEGVKKLEMYRKQWDARRLVWKDRPFHDGNSHAADSFQTLAMGHDMVVRQGKIGVRKQKKAEYKW